MLPGRLVARQGLLRRVPEYFPSLPLPTRLVILISSADCISNWSCLRGLLVALPASAPFERLRAVGLGKTDCPGLGRLQLGIPRRQTARHVTQHRGQQAQSGARDTIGKTAMATLPQSSIMKVSPYKDGLGKTEANYAPLSPLSFLPKAAETYPNRIAIIHGEQRRHLGGDLHTLPPSRIGFAQARDRSRAIRSR